MLLHVISCLKDINKSLLNQSKCSFHCFELGVLHKMIKPISLLFSSFSSQFPVVLQSELLQIPSIHAHSVLFLKVSFGFSNLSSPSASTPHFPMDYFLTSHPFSFIPRLVRISVSLNTYKNSNNSKMVIFFLALGICVAVNFFFLSPWLHALESRKREIAIFLYCFKFSVHFLTLNSYLI